MESSTSAGRPWSVLFLPSYSIPKKTGFVKHFFKEIYPTLRNFFVLFTESRICRRQTTGIAPQK
jgi:hypothetical protein